MRVEKFAEILDSDFFVGVPDSQLKVLCDYLFETYGIDSQHHMIAANEGNCTALAAGYHLATGKYPVVYLQNSGEGNIMNPVVSLLNDKVYAIPMIFVIGWRGEPGLHDEPQHIYQGEITIKLLEDMDIQSFIIDQKTEESEVLKAMEGFRELMRQGKSVAFVIRKGALLGKSTVQYQNSWFMTREEIIRYITEVSGDDPIISTTGKASRELFEIREAADKGHQCDFLTVGSMGHSSSIALGIALQKKKTKIWCIDGDGAVLMHMGAMAVIGSHKPKNLIHIMINNESHETVGGMPTVAGSIDFVSVAKGCGYEYAVSVFQVDDLKKELMKAKDGNVLSFIEVKCSIGARENLGRPTVSAIENKNSFMRYLKKC